MISSDDHFYQTMQEAFSERKVIAQRLGESDLRKRSHLIVNLSLFQRDKTGTVTTSQLNFAELAGTEQ